MQLIFDFITLLASIFQSRQAVNIIDKYNIVKMPNHTIFTMSENYYDPLAAIIILRSSEFGEDLHDKEVHQLTMVLISQIYLMEYCSKNNNSIIAKFANFVISDKNKKILNQLYMLALNVNLPVKTENKDVSTGNSN